MTCENARERLDDYVDGELEASALHELELHLASCPSCREEEEVLRSLLARAAELPRTMAPGRDLWPGVAEAIREEKRSRVLGFERRRVVFAGFLAAAAALVVALGLPRPGPDPGTPPSTGSSVPALVAASPGSDLREAEADYERATKALLDTLEEQRDRIAPQTLQGVEQNLAVIDEALREVRAALHQEPGNPELTRMLAATHHKKVEVLQRVVRLSTSRL
jgi:hypothetical protein